MSVWHGWRRRAIFAVLVAAMFGAVSASTRDETVITVQVSSADHELIEGYFTLGDNLTVMAKPGSDVHRFLARHRGRKVKIALTEASTPGPARLDR